MRWAPVPDWPGYEVTRCGRVRSTDRTVRFRRTNYAGDGRACEVTRVLAGRERVPTARGTVKLCRDGSGAWLPVAELVRLAFGE